jgi:hypothetical protein
VGERLARMELDSWSFAALPYDSRRGLRRGACGSHTGPDRQKARCDREEDVRWARVSHWRQHGGGGKRPGWSIGSRRPDAVRHARREDERSPHGNARAANAGVATSRSGRPPHQTPARQVGRTWHGIRSLATREALDRLITPKRMGRLDPVRRIDRKPNRGPSRPPRAGNSLPSRRRGKSGSDARSAT